MPAELTLYPRLRAIADLVPCGTRLVDVGTDHGYLPVWLLSQGRVASAIATDIVPGPLDHARRTAGQYLNDMTVLDFRLCDGLAAVVPEEVDTIVIAGMGGETIAHILEAAPWTKEGVQLFLQPMSKVEFLREWLVSNGYCIQAERLVQDKGFLYTVLSVAGGEGSLQAPGQFWYGWAAPDDPLFSAYLDRQLQKLRQIIGGLEQSVGSDRQERLRHFQALLAALEEKRCTQ